MKIRILNGGARRDRLSGGAPRHPFRSRGDGGRADPRIPRNIDQARNFAGRAAAAEHQSRGLSRSSREPVRQSEDRRHDPTPLLRRLEPAAEVHSSIRPRSPEIRRERQGAGAGLGLMVPLLLRRNRERQADCAQRPELGAPSRRGEAGAQRSARLPQVARHLRRARGHESLCRRVRRARSVRSGQRACARRWPTIFRAARKPRGRPRRGAERNQARPGSRTRARSGAREEDARWRENWTARSPR